jgi:hypothetical protein
VGTIAVTGCVCSRSSSCCQCSVGGSAHRRGVDDRVGAEPDPFLRRRLAHQHAEPVHRLTATFASGLQSACFERVMSEIGHNLTIGKQHGIAREIMVVANDDAHGLHHHVGSTDDVDDARRRGLRQ